ncbi:MAG TPA: hypothetical protein IAC41_05925, partial [Candidatus Merdenecus merdavium]|nr:hypothetical protein [Candidatus Merdenecus merdavium]
MRSFISSLRELKEFNNLETNLQHQKGIHEITGCIDSQKSHLMYVLGLKKKYKIVITQNDLKAKEIYEDYKFFDKDVLLYPAKDLIF